MRWYKEPGDPLNWSPPPSVGAPKILCWEWDAKLWQMDGLFGVGLNHLPPSRTKTKSSLGKAPSSLFPAFGQGVCYPQMMSSERPAGWVQTH